MSEKQLLHPSQIRTDGGTQMRAELDPATIDEYAQSIQAGALLPPIVVYYDGSEYWLGDGFHRLAARKKLFEGAIECEVRSGTRRDAVLCAAGANATHGRRRTNADKRRSVETLLRDQEWGQWSDREIAKVCWVDHKTVGNLRRELTGEIPQIPTERTVQRNGQTYTMQTTNIAAANQQRQPIATTPAAQHTYQSEVAATPTLSHPSPLSHPSHDKEIVEDLPSAIRRAVTVYQGDLETWQNMAAVGASDQEIMQRLAQSIKSKGASSGPGWYYAEHLVHKGGPCIRISRNLNDHEPILMASGQDLINQVRKAWGIPSPASTLRPLDSTETEAVIWRAIQHSGNKTPIDQLAWLQTATKDDFRKLINPNVVFDTTLFNQALERVQSELHRQSQPATPVKVATVEPVEAPRPHVTNNSGNNEWYTPAPITEAARKVLGAIDLDPASCSVANEVVKAAKFYSITDDGLNQPWAGRIWLNPPYSSDLVGKFIEKLTSHIADDTVTEAIVLVNNATETAWFQDLAGYATAVCFPKGRIKYWSPDRPDALSPLQGQGIVYIGPHSYKFRSIFSDFGVVL